MRLTSLMVGTVLSLGANFTSAAEPIRVACVGDSITAGWGLPNPAVDSYPAQLQALLGTGYLVGNFGHSGATLARTTDRPYWAQAEFTLAKEFNPNIVVIKLGTNDAHPARWDSVKDEFVPTFKQLIAAFRELPSKPRIFVCLPVPSFEARKINIETGVIPLVRQACREADVPIIDLFNPLADHEALFPDRLHPNAAGAGIMAAIVHHAISDPTARKKRWRVKSADSEETAEGPASYAIDGNADTYWHTGYSKSTPKHPHELVIDLGKVQPVFGVSLLPRKIGVNGRVRDYELLAAADAAGSGVKVAGGKLAGRTDEEIVFLEKPVVARFLTLRALSEVNGGPWTSLAELDVLIAPTATDIKLQTTRPATSQAAANQSKVPFEIGESDFLLNGRPFVIRSGEMHAARVPREYWRHRLEMIRAMGCNTVCAYLFWNQHEPRPGEFNFSGDADAAEYCRIAQQIGLKVILRPGPYSCAEWDLGGLPWWLLKHDGIKLRSREPRYLDAATEYLQRVGKELAPLQITRGGPIIMVQVENEYGSYGNDKEYIRALRDSLRDAGFDVPLFTCDGPSQLKNDTLDDTFCVVNFGSNPVENFKALREIRPKGPLMCGEYYPGWFDSWGNKHHTGDTARIVRELGSMLENRQSFSIYMVHGGTSFAMTAGANSPPFRPQSTSYDYDAPIDEAGWATPKYHALRELFAKHLNEGESIPEIPPPPAKVMAVPEIRMSSHTPLWKNLGRRRREFMPKTMEELDQAGGIIVYRAELPAGPAGELSIREPHDLAQVFLDSRRIGAVDRRWKRNRLAIEARSKPAQLDIMVEAFGRVNLGGDLEDRKGITLDVNQIVDGNSWRLTDWTHHRLQMDNDWLDDLRLNDSDAVCEQPCVYRGEFELSDTGDTFIDMRGWKRGMVWINHHNLGRYWNIGPQQTLYCPGCWLKAGVNEMHVLDTDGGVERPAVRGLDAPILDEVHEDPDAPKPIRRAGQTLSLANAKPAGQATLDAGTGWQTAEFESVRGRYVCIEALNSQRGDAFTTCAELRVREATGRDIPSSRCQVIYADSEELSGDDGIASNVLDGMTNSFWHAQWQNGAPKHPHYLVIDLGREETVSGVRILPRQDSPNGRMKSIRVYVSANKFEGL